jgi:hypothetical protein
MNTERYDEFLDEIYPEIKIGILTYSVSQVLKKVDPIAYREGLNDFEDMLEREEN